MKNLLQVILMFVVLNAWSDPLPLATITDPAGDDSGDGTMRYPQRSDFQTGDLDLLQVKISRDHQGYWFEVTLKNPVRDPAGVHATVGGDSLADSVRKGFYQFNIDIYVDTDRIKGSGNGFTLPGRKVHIDADYAWERAVILTPRPELMREQLIGALTGQYPDMSSTEIRAAVDQALFFPTRIMVRGKTIRYFVPAGFLGGGEGSNWAITALVTGALTSVPVEFSLDTNRKPLDDLVLGVMQPTLGYPRDTFGYSDHLPCPVVDMLGVSAEQQIRQLAGKEPLTGVSWGAQATAAGAQEVPVLPSVAPIARLLQPETTVVAVPAESGVEEVPPNADLAISKRLRSLRQLFEQKLIDEAEYKQQRQRILNEL
jgi:hypothetical protein